jgi:beta-glucosidase
VKQLKNESNAKIIVVYFGGRPRLLGDIVDSADSILIAFLPGPDAGQAVVEIITGDQNPSGRLAITYPKYQDGGGIPYWHTVSDQCTESNNPHEPLPHWIYAQCEVQWPFGYGLSYTSFKYTNLKVDSKTILHGLPWSDDGIGSSSIKVSIDVQNTGSRRGFETIMLFLFVENRHVTPEYKQLIGYKRRKIDPGQTITQEFEVTTDMLRYVGPHDDRHDILQIGQKFRVGVGPTTDCRRMESNELCTEMLTLDFHGKDIYEPSCEASCLLLETNGCLTIHKLSASDCYTMCRSSHSPIGSTVSFGWGWNYLNCIESILFDKTRSNERKCYDVDNMCRNIFASTTSLDNKEEDTSIMDQSRTRPPTVEETGFAKNDFETVAMAVLAGVIGTLIIVYPFYRNARYSSKTRKGKDQIAFSPISRNEELDLELEII